MRSARAVLLSIPFLLAAVPELASAAAADSLAATTRVIIKWRDASPGDGSMLAAKPSRFESLRSRNSSRFARGWNIGGPLSVLQLEREQRGDQLSATLAALRADPDVEFAEPDARVKSHAYTPNDPLYATEQWYLQSTQIAAIRANDAWDITRGGTSPATSNVVVAVLDSGIRLDHPDLADKLLPGWDFVSTALVGNDGDGWDADANDPGDYMTEADLQNPDFADGECGGGDNHDLPTASSWHGTRVAGLIAAASDNNLGIAGTAFHVRLLPVRVLGKCGGYVSDVIAAMYWAAGMAPPPPYMQTPIPPVNRNPARVINMSLGTDNPCTSSASAVYRVAVEQITANGTLIVASTGNSGAAVGSPASCPGVLAVAGLRHVGTKVGYSNLGPEVGIAAPAGNCVNVAPGAPCLFALNTITNLGQTIPEANGYSTPLVQATVGTSFSTPLASGTAALMLSVNPTLTPAQLIQHIRASARPFPTTSDTVPAPPACVSPTVTPVQNTECICSTAYCGAGMLDTHAAVLAAQGAPQNPDPPGGGGGGAAGLGSLLALFSLWLNRRRVHS